LNFLIGLDADTVWSGCDSVQARRKKALKVLRKKGVIGRLTQDKCAVIGLKIDMLPKIAYSGLFPREERIDDF
jgi:hypothetical protein